MTTERKMPLDSEFQMPSLRLDGRTALVTGGGRGLGLGMAQALAHAGANIALASRTESELEAAAEMIRAIGRKAIILPTDVGDAMAVQAMVRKAAEELGRLDILVNAAGINFRKPWDTFTIEDWDKIISVNLKGAFFAAQEAARIMRDQKAERACRGKIINVGSIASEIVVPNVAL